MANEQAGTAAVMSTNNSVLEAIQLLPVSSAGNNNGPESTFVGPLAALNKNPYAQQNLSYPRDLGSSKKLHSVQFRAIQVSPTDFNEIMSSLGKTAQEKYDQAMKNFEAIKKDPVAAGTAAYETAQKEIVDASQGLVNFFKDPGGTTKTALSGLGGTISNAADSANSFKPLSYTQTPTGNANDTITLYMPDNAEFSYNASYNQVGLLEAAASIPKLGALPNAILSTLNNSAARVALNSMGYVFNPQEQVLFEGIGFRTFSMSFTLTPFSRSEASDISNIIKTFRKNAAPTIQTGGAGFFFVPPSIFEVAFLYNGAENPNINKLKRCVLTDVNVNYAPNGTWSTHDDGSPVQTSLTLSFKEIELVDRTAVESGY